MNEPQYRFAFNRAGLLVDSLRLTEENRDVFKCPSCGKALSLVLPIQNIVKHFRHKTAGECNAETYLHRAAKQAFKQAYEYHAKRDGYFLVGRESLKISDVFTHVALEQRDDDTTPDITLSDGVNRKLFIEIAVTHKIHWRTAQIRWYPTIEIDIANEGDIEGLKEGRLNLFSEKVRLYDNGLDCREYMTAHHYLTRNQWSYIERYGPARLRKPDMSSPSILCALLEIGVLRHNQEIDQERLNWILERYNERQKAI